MSKVILAFSISLDGFVAGPNVGEENPMGVGGEQLHDWIFARPLDAGDKRAIEEEKAEIGAVIIGRRTFDIGFPHWDEDVPYPGPSFVLTHRPAREQKTRSGSFRFVPDVATAVREARAAAGGKAVNVMGGAAARQILGAGHADRLNLHLVPVLLGSGVRIFEDTPGNAFRLVRTGCVPTERVTHLKFDVVHQKETQQ